MPRYYFNVRDGHDFEDVEGVELRDCRAARQEGVRLSGALLLDEADQFGAEEVSQMEVSDHTGLILFLITVSIMPSSDVAPPYMKRTVLADTMRSGSVSGEP